MAPGYSPSSRDVCSPTSPSPFGTSPYATSPVYDRARGPTSPISHHGLTSGVTGAAASGAARSVVTELAQTIRRLHVTSQGLEQTAPEADSICEARMRTGAARSHVRILVGSPE